MRLKIISKRQALSIGFNVYLWQVSFYSLTENTRGFLRLIWKLTWHIAWVVPEPYQSQPAKQGLAVFVSFPQVKALSITSHATPGLQLNRWAETEPPSSILSWSLGALGPKRGVLQMCFETRHRGCGRNKSSRDRECIYNQSILSRFCFVSCHLSHLFP